MSSQKVNGKISDEFGVEFSTKRVKVAIIGNRKTGKTSLIRSMMRE